MNKNEKEVLLPIIVPRGDHCFVSEKEFYVVCGHFTNFDNQPNCELDIGLLDYTPENTVLKPSACYTLETAWDLHAHCK